MILVSKFFELRHLIADRGGVQPHITITMLSIRRSCQSALRNSNGPAAYANGSRRAFSRSVARAKGAHTPSNSHHLPMLTIP